MGRGRQKAKQTKVARELKYSSYEPNYRALEQELTGGRSDVATEESAPRDPYSAWPDEDDDER
jgi:hypothetical protein